jgi:hypothetical protein
MTSKDANSGDQTSGAPEEAVPVACFSVLTEADPSAVPRVLEIFALRDLIPSQIHVTPGAAVKICARQRPSW